MFVRTLSRIVCVAVLMCAVFAAHAAESLKIIIPTPPGGGTDLYFRVLAKAVEPILGEPVVILNVPGAGGTIGITRLVSATPDGQTVAGVWVGPVTVTPNTMKVPYTPADYVPIIQVSSAPYVICVHADFPAKDARGFIAELKRNPDKYTYGTDGPGGTGHLATARILRAFGASARDVPFKGAGETLTAFLGHHIDIYTGSAPPILQYERLGQANCLLLTSADRIASMPNATSLRELGIPDDETILWRAVLAPKGTPPERVKQLQQAFDKAANSPDARKFLEDAGEQVAIRAGSELRTAIDAEYAAMGKLARELRLSP